MLQFPKACKFNVSLCRYGSAPGADVGSVRVLDCEGNGRISDVISGLDAAGL